MADPWVPGLLEHPSWDLLQQDSAKETSTILKTMGSQGAFIQYGVCRIRSLNWPVTHSARDLDRTRKKVMQEEERHNLSDISMDVCTHSTLRPPEVVYCPRYYAAGTAWYVVIKTDPPLVDPKVEMQLVQNEGEGAILEATIPVTDSQLAYLRWIGTYARIRVILHLLVTLNIWQANLERKGETLPPWLHN